MEKNQLVDLVETEFECQESSLFIAPFDLLVLKLWIQQLSVSIIISKPFQLKQMSEALNEDLVDRQEQDFEHRQNFYIIAFFLRF